MDIVDLTGDSDENDETVTSKPHIPVVDVTLSPAKRPLDVKPHKIPPLPLKRLKINDNVAHGFKQSTRSRDSMSNIGKFSENTLNKKSESNCLAKAESLATPTKTDFPADDEVENALLQAGTSYYWSILNRLIRHCLIDEFEGRLLKSSHRQKLLFFSQFPENEQKLAFRLYMRKSVWQRKSSLKYQEIDFDLRPIIDKLISKNIFTVPSDDMELSEMLDLLRADQLQTIASQLKLPKKNMNQTKSEILKLCKQKSPFATTKPLKEKVREACLPFLSDLFRLSKWFATALNYVLFVSTMFASNLSVDADLFCVSRIVFQISTLGLSPPFQISRSLHIFKGPEEFQIYFGIRSIINEVDKLLLAKDYAAALKTVKLGFDLCEAVPDDRKIPGYLRRYSCQSALSKLKSQEIEIHCKLKGFAVAAKCLENKISFASLSRRHGDDIEKLAKIYETNLYERAKSVQILRKALLELHLPEHNLLGMAEKAHKLRRKLVKVKKSEPLEDDDENELPKWECDFADGKCCEILDKYLIDKLTVEEIHAKRAPFVEDYQSLRFIYRSSQQSSSLMCSVEQYVLTHLKEKEAFTYGLHKEGYIFMALFHALFADIVYSDNVPNVFFSPYQQLPLDWMTKDFMENRSELIRCRYIDLECSFKRKDIIRDNCDRFPDLAHSSMFEDTDSLIELSESFKIHQLEKIFSRIFELGSYSGMPDLCMWGNSEKRNCKQLVLCEVKGPGDTLSNKQIVWLHYFREIGVNAKIVRVISTMNANE